MDKPWELFVISNSKLCSSNVNTMWYDNVNQVIMVLVVVGCIHICIWSAMQCTKWTHSCIVNNALVWVSLMCISIWSMIWPVLLCTPNGEISWCTMAIQRSYLYKTAQRLTSTQTAFLHWIRLGNPIILAILHVSIFQHGVSDTFRGQTSIAMHCILKKFEWKVSSKLPSDTEVMQTIRTQVTDLSVEMPKYTLNMHRRCHQEFKHDDIIL